MSSPGVRLTEFVGIGTFNRTLGEPLRPVRLSIKRQAASSPTRRWLRDLMLNGYSSQITAQVRLARKDQVLAPKPSSFQKTELT